MGATWRRRTDELHIRRGQPGRLVRHGGGVSPTGAGAACGARGRRGGGAVLARTGNWGAARRGGRRLGTSATCSARRVVDNRTQQSGPGPLHTPRICRRGENTTAANGYVCS